LTSPEQLRRLLYYSPSSDGGAADCSHEQANALADQGVDVELLCTPAWRFGRGERYRVNPALLAPQSGSSPRWLKRVTLGRSLLHNMSILADRIAEGRFRHVLLGAYTEYLAPLWAWKLRRLAGQGVIFGAIVHDPVRDYQVGPAWWHRRSVAAGYSFLNHAFVHDAIELDTIRPMPQLRTTVIPHGCLTFPPASLSGSKVREQLGLPVQSKVMLSFGYIRDGKNLDLILQAMVHFPELYLLVAGKVSSGSQRPVEYYQELAGRLGIADRCRWIIGFIPEEEIGNLFAASDLLLLTYSKNFRSASGVLNTAIFYRKSCLASSGQGSLCSVVKKFDLGIWVEPDDLGALKSGIERWRRQPPVPKWEAYEAENSWRRNAELVIEQFNATSGTN
jgi:glycosyltransferase involved in cell wall biosynthesis